MYEKFFNYRLRLSSNYQKAQVNPDKKSSYVNRPFFPICILAGIYSGVLCILSFSSNSMIYSFGAKSERLLRAFAGKLTGPGGFHDGYPGSGA
jgi:hypothetical protein